jgi:hypothetical protein
VELGELEAAIEQLDAVEAQARAQDERSVTAWCVWLRAHVAAQRDRSDPTGPGRLDEAEALAGELSLAALAACCAGTRGMLAGCPG